MLDIFCLQITTTSTGLTPRYSSQKSEHTHTAQPHAWRRSASQGASDPCTACAGGPSGHRIRVWSIRTRRPDGSSRLPSHAVLSIGRHAERPRVLASSAVRSAIGPCAPGTINREVGTAEGHFGRGACSSSLCGHVELLLEQIWPDLAN